MVCMVVQDPSCLWLTSKYCLAIVMCSYLCIVYVCMHIKNVIMEGEGGGKPEGDRGRFKNEA